MKTPFEYWSGLTQQLGMAHEDSILGFRLLEQLYRGRAYHNLTHIECMLKALDSKTPTEWFGTENPDAACAVVEMAVWFHDAIYSVDDAAGLNEYRSGRLARAFLTQAVMHPVFVERVEACIRATAHSRVMPVETTHKVIADLDLAGLAAPWTVYCETGALIRREYEHLTLPEWWRGRDRFLTMMLSREAVFSTAVYRDMEPTARRNMEAERTHVRSLLALAENPS